MEVEQFTLTDRKGNAHSYTLCLHPGTEGAAIAASLGLAGLAPLGEALQGLVAGGGKLSDALDSPDLLSALKGGDLGAKAAASLRTLDLGPLSAELLRYATRDGHKLSDKKAFDAAFAGNYGELAQAAWRSISLNGFLPLLDMITGES